MDLNDLFLSMLFWSILLAALSYLMLQARPANQTKYAEVIGNLILLALITIILTAVTA